MKKSDEIVVNPGTPKAVRISYETFSSVVKAGLYNRADFMRTVKRALRGRVLSPEDEDTVRMSETLIGDALDRGDAEAAWSAQLRVIRIAGLVFSASRMRSHIARGLQTQARVNASQTFLNNYRVRCPAAGNNVMIRATVEHCDPKVSESFIRRHLRDGSLSIPPKDTTR